MTAVEQYRPLTADRHYMNQLPQLVNQLARSSMCPDPWRIKPGEPADVQEQKVADLMVVGHTLADLDVRFGVTTLPQVFVVHGRPGLMAQLQIALASRHGCDIVPLDEESSAEQAVVKAKGKDGEWHRVTVTMEEAKLAKWPEKNPNYKTMPDRMLAARAVTKAIGLHCPEAKMMLPAGNLLDDPQDLDEPTGPAPRSLTPDGTTIPEAKREPAIDDDTRAQLLARLEALTPDQTEQVKQVWQDLRIPHLKTAQVTRAHGALITRLIDDAVGTQTGEIIDAEEVPGDGEQQTFDDPDGDPFD